MLSYFPSCEEMVVLSERPTRQTLTIAPAVGLSVVGANITVGSYSVEREGIRQETLKLTARDAHGTDVYWLVALCTSSPLVPLTGLQFFWAFRNLVNDNCQYSPSSIQFLIVVTTSPGRAPKFPFELQILSEVEVIPKGLGWNSVRLLFRTKRAIQPINIKEALDSKRAEECLKDLRNGQPAVGLKKAMVPYERALRILPIT